MNLSEQERYIIIADSKFNTLEQKCMYVNLKMGFINSDGMILSEFKKQIINARKYHRLLGTIDVKIKQYGHSLGKNFLKELIMEEVQLSQDLIEFAEIQVKSQKKEHYSTALKAKEDQISTRERRLDLIETIHDYMSDRPLEGERITEEEAMEICQKL